jgi:hypothetical protein
MLSQNLLSNQVSIHSQSIAQFQSVHQTPSISTLASAGTSHRGPVPLALTSPAHYQLSTSNDNNSPPRSTANKLFNNSQKKNIRVYQKNHPTLQDQRKQRYHDLLSTIFNKPKKDTTVPNQV